jgi:Ca2+-binding RTX toxin-like protein
VVWVRVALTVVGMAVGFLPMMSAQAGVVTCAGRPATIVGTAAGDVLVGTAGSDVIAAQGGDDLVRGRGGDDRICGGYGSDSLRAARAGTDYSAAAIG